MAKRKKPAVAPEVNISGLCRCGCGQRTAIATSTRKAFGIVQGMPMHYIRFHQTVPNNIKRTKKERWVIDDNGCWIWQLFIHPNGYGRTRPGEGESSQAHRRNWEEKHGPVPEGLVLDHLCKNRACVNPDHLEPVTSRENSLRGDGTKLNIGIARAIRNEYAAGTISMVNLGLKFNVSNQTVFRIVHNKSWREEDECNSEIINRDVLTPSLLPELKACADSLLWPQQVLASL